MSEKKQYRELAARIYDLDTEIYEILGSSLGRVYLGSREKNIDELSQLLASRPSAAKLRSELALISNMARTINDKEAHKDIMRKYDAILKEASELQYSYDGEDIIDPEIAALNLSNLENRFDKDDKLIITIGRAYGCAGSDIGFKLADKLRISYYDVSIMNELIRRDEENGNTEHELFEDNTRHTPAQWCRDFVKYHGLPRQDVSFFNTSRTLVELAKKESFVVVGRFADTILTNNKIPHISIFITAPFDLRVRRHYEINKDTITMKQAYKYVEREDAKHMERYRFYTGRRWGTAANYDITINSASYGIDGAVDLIMRVLDKYHSKV
ncbi:MAG: AAA family ATPase [Lachnospira sp.]